jgi:hypothetical protein
MNVDSMLGPCEAFIRAVASQWSGGGRLRDDATKAHEL